jgi:hypothetical protein
LLWSATSLPPCEWYRIAFHDTLSKVEKIYKTEAWLELSGWVSQDMAREVKGLIPRVLKNCKETFYNGMLLLCHPISMCFLLSHYSYFVSLFSKI